MLPMFTKWIGDIKNKFTLRNSYNVVSERVLIRYHPVRFEVRPSVEDQEFYMSFHECHNFEKETKVD